MQAFRVDDMTCGHCASAIAKAIRGADNDADVTIDPSQHLVMVEPTEADVHELSDAITDAGYPPVAVPSATVVAKPARRAAAAGAAADQTRGAPCDVSIPCRRKKPRLTRAYLTEVPMKLALAVFGASLVLAGCATDPKEEDHAAHYPPGAATAAPGTPTPGQMDSMMKSMQEMHDKMMAAKTPEERAKLMQEQMKVMQDGMGVMGRMHGGRGGAMDGMGMGRGGMAMSPEMMGKRMDMMEMMMQMMMDREAMEPPATR